MGKIDYFDIQFEGSPPFHAGQRIVGSVIVNAKDPIKIRDITVLLKGESRTFWVNKSSDKIFETIQTHFSEQLSLGRSYLDVHSDGETLPEGAHTLQFSYNLARDLPSSFDRSESQAGGGYDVIGYTRYTCSARIESFQTNCLMLISGRQVSEYACDKSLTILALTTPGFAGANQPVTREEVIDLMGCLGSQGTIRTVIQLLKSEYSLGETISVAIKIENQSRRKIKQIDLLLMQSVVLTARSRYENVEDHKEFVKCMEAAHYGPIKANKNEDFTGQLVVPACAPTQLQGIIRIQYFLKITADSEAFELSFPVVLVCPWKT